LEEKIMSQHYVYHPKFDAKAVSSEEYQKLLQEGWYDSPDKFPEDEKKKQSYVTSDSAPETQPPLGSVQVVVPAEEIKRRGRPPTKHVETKNATEENITDAGV
jgi:hypothetical protein